MNLHAIITKTSKLVADNSPAILTAIGVTGTMITAYLTGKASFKAADRILTEQDRLDFTLPQGQDHQLTTKEKTKLVWKEYIPAVSTGVLTVTSIIFANRIGARRTAALAAAYSISEKAWAEYKEKVVEKIGPGKEQKIRDELAQERVDRNPVSTKQVLITGTGDNLCYDTVMERYFQSNMETLRRAQNDINAQIINGDGHASLADFYILIGLRPTPGSYDVGWNRDRMLDIDFTAVLGEDGRPCMAFSYTLYPTRDHHN